jgi:lactoylglutathione lyase
MRIEHIALWTGDLERSRSFYEKWFGARAGRKYVNPSKGFASYFLTFPSGARLEIMTLPALADPGAGKDSKDTGYAHIAFSAGSEKAVDSLTKQISEAGHTVVNGPRRTGDGYYESVVLDPDGNRLEITV